jgi:probable rRNA maturation factor
MTYTIDIQNATDTPLPVTEEQLTQWATLALPEQMKEAELTIRLVSPEEMVHLNSTYRKQNKVTNVLAFPYELPDSVASLCPLLGDVVICPQVLLKESQEYNKPLEAYWAHMLIHGILHLLGYDHIEEADAQVMQAFEINLMEEIGYTNPYA